MVKRLFTSKGQDVFPLDRWTFRKDFFPDFSCTHGRTCVSERYAPGFSPLNPNIADKNIFDKILFNPKFLLPLTLDENQPTGSVPCKEWINTRISRLDIDESNTVLDSELHVVHGFLLWQDFSDFRFLGIESWFQKSRIPNFAICTDSLIWRKEYWYYI